MREKPRRGSLRVAMTDVESDRETYERLADAISEALRGLAHDAANCAAVFDMEVSELGAHDATGVGDSLRAATDRLRAHVNELRGLAGARRTEDCALDELLVLSLRLLSRSARQDLLRVPGDRTPTRVRAPQLQALFSTLLAVRGVIRSTDGKGLLRASVGPESVAPGTVGGRGVIRLDVELDAPAFERIAEATRRTLAGIGELTTSALTTGDRPPFSLGISCPLSSGSTPG